MPLINSTGSKSVNINSVKFTNNLTTENGIVEAYKKDVSYLFFYNDSISKADREYLSKSKLLDIIEKCSNEDVSFYIISPIK